jgi:hypothetical protein
VASSTADHFTADFDDLGAVADALVQDLVMAEEVFFRGSLRAALDRLGSTAPDSSVPGIPLDGAPGDGYDEIQGDATDPTRDCFPDSTTQYIGFAWYLPVDHANEIQTDSVSFDLGFYTEQCRHNDGAGQAPETPTDNDDGTDGNANT